MNKLTFLLAMTALLFISSCKKDSDDNTINVPTDGLVSYFKFDGNLKDEKGNTPEGSNNGSAPFVSGKVGQAISVNGIDQHIEFDRKTFKDGNNISVALWFKKKTIDKLFLIVCDDFAISMSDSPGVFQAGIAISVPGTNSAHGNYTADVWTHFVGTYDGTDIKIYINGILQETKNHPGNITAYNRSLEIGRFGSSYCSGSVDELLIYDKTLTQTEVNQLYGAY